MANLPTDREYQVFWDWNVLDFDTGSVCTFTPTFGGTWCLNHLGWKISVQVDKEVVFEWGCMQIA